MNATARKMSKIADELINFFFAIGSKGVKMNLEDTGEGYLLTLSSQYDPQEQKRVNDLQKFLVVSKQERDKGLEEFFWELAGMNPEGDDSELHLIGHMLDKVDVNIWQDHVELALYKKKD